MRRSRLLVIAPIDTTKVLGAPASPLTSVASRKETPLRRESNDGYWPRNHGAHLSMTGKTGGC